MSPYFVLFLTFLGVGCTMVTGNPWYSVGGAVIIAVWILANTWWRYRP